MVKVVRISDLCDIEFHDPEVDGWPYVDDGPSGSLILPPRERIIELEDQLEQLELKRVSVGVRVKPSKNKFKKVKSK